MENAVVRLGVARLTESGEAAGYCRHQPERALEGYCLVVGDEWGCRVTLFLQHGRTLTERTDGGLFYYEGWLVTPEGPVSLGVFNTGAAGEGSAHYDPGAWALDRAVGIRVTAEPHGGSVAGHRPVLEGQLIWLQGQPAAAPEADSDPVSDAAAQAALDSASEPERAPLGAAPPREPLPDAQWHPAHQTATAGGAAPWSELLT
ncbi:MAG: hypothetical protein JWN15_2820, partial [Firmicutes bacterium]|nr:hypothetical protein [Bacillota bacterium]